MNDILDEIDNQSNQTIHIRIVQRSKKKFTTIIEGLGDHLDLKMLLKNFKKTFNCSGAIVDNKIKLTGDMRDKVITYLVDNDIVEKDNIKIHGY